MNEATEQDWCNVSGWITKMTADVRQKKKENPPEQPAKSADIFFVFFLFWRQSCPNDLIRQVGPTATAWATFGAGPFFISTVASLAPVRKKVPTPQVRPLVRLMIDTLRYALVMFYYPQNQADSSTICCESPRRDFAKKTRVRCQKIASNRGNHSAKVCALRCAVLGDE